MYYRKTSEKELQLHPWGISCVREPDGRAAYQRLHEENTATVRLAEPDETDAYPLRNDLLWKGILEEVFDDFLRFFFPNAAERFDLERGAEYLDKELQQLFPPEDEEFAPRHVDKLVKVFTREGPEAWILLHCEVQGYRQGEFAERMFRYYYRVWDKYQRPLTAVAILTDGDKSFRPACFEQSFLNTSLCYRFTSYKVLDQDEAELEQSDNPFALVILTVKAALKGKKGLTDEELYKLKLDLARRLHEKQIPEKKQRALLNFLKYYLRFHNEATNLKFEQSINKITGRKTTMGIEELLLAQAEHFGEVKGKKKGIAIGEARGEARGIKTKELTFVRSLLQDTDFSIEKIASLAGVTVAFVKKMRLELSVARRK